MGDRHDRLMELATALSDGATIDWTAAESSAASDSERLQIRRLRLVSEVSDAPASSSWQDGARGDVHDSLLHPHGHPDDAGEEATPVSWGPLTVVEKIGKGRFGDVYRARDPRLDRDVALKLLRRRSDGGDMESLVIDEGRLLAKIRHPNVVTVFGAERSAGRAGVWMELVRGKTLEDELTSHGPFAPPDVARAGIEVCRALEAVHRAGLVHRDVKAQNVMRDDDGRLVLMDFGTGRELETSTAPSDLAGTPLYLAPEVLAGAPATPRSDLYSVGVLLFHLSTGAFPVSGATLREIRDAHLKRQTTCASACVGLSPTFQALLDRALSADPDHRFASAAEFESALAAEIESSTTGARPPRRRWGLAVGAGVIVLAAAAAAAAWGGLLGGAGGTAAAVAGLRATERVLWTGPSAPAWAAVSPDGRFVAYIEETNGNLVLRDLRTGQVRPLTTDADWNADDGDWAEQPVFSRDGRRIAYGWLVTTPGEHPFWQLRVLDLDVPGVPTAQPIYDYREPGWFGPYDWSPDGTAIAVAMRVADMTSRVGWVSVPDKALTVVARGDWRISRLVTWSPDGRRLAYDAAPSEQSPTSDVYVVSADGTEVAPVTSGPGNDSVAGWLPSGDVLFLNEGRGTRGLWAQQVVDGRATGAARLVRPDLRGDLVAPTFTGNIDLSLMTNPQAIYSASVDLASGQLSRAAEPAVSGFSPRNRQPKWSKDGSLLAFISSAHERLLSHRILTIEAADEQQTRVLPLKLAQIWTYDWSPDKRLLLARAQSLQGARGIFQIDAATGAVSHLLAWTDDVRQFLPQWADDGKSFYYTKVRPGKPDETEFVLRDLASGRERPLFRYAKLTAPGGGRLPGNRDSTISPDRQYVVCYTTQPESVLWLIRLSDLSVRELYRVPRRNALVHNALAWAPDSRGVIVNQAAGESGRELWMVPIEGAPRRLDVGPVMVRAEAVAIHPDNSQIAFVAGDPRTFELIRLENAALTSRN